MCISQVANTAGFWRARLQNLIVRGDQKVQLSIVYSLWTAYKHTSKPHKNVIVFALNQNLSDFMTSAYGWFHIISSSLLYRLLNIIFINHNFSYPSSQPICLTQLPLFLFDLANGVLCNWSSPVKPVTVDHFDSPNWSKAKQISHIWQTVLTSGLCISSLHDCLPQTLIAYLWDMRWDELQKVHSGEAMWADGEQVLVQRSDSQGRKCHSLAKSQRWSSFTLYWG